MSAITLEAAEKELRDLDAFPGFGVVLAGTPRPCVFTGDPMPYEEWQDCLEYAAWVYGAYPSEVLTTLADPRVIGYGLFCHVQAGMVLGYHERYTVDPWLNRARLLRQYERQRTRKRRRNRRER